MKDFLDGITDSSLQQVKFIITGFTNLLQNFNDAANNIGNITDLNKKNEINAREASAAGTGWGRGRGERGGRGKDNHGSGRNQRGGHGRSVGRNNGRGGQGGRNAKKKVLADGSVPMSGIKCQKKTRSALELHGRTMLSIV